jgi:hypothetical protein
MRIFAFLISLLMMLAPTAARAELVVTFYSHDLGSTFPHAFITVNGTTSDGQVVNTNYGFTAKAVTPAVLWGSVGGKVELLSASYIKSSDRQFALTINDSQYTALLAHVEKWRTAKQPSYNLNKASCLHFVGGAAAILGMKVAYPKALMRKPKSFLQSLLALNPWAKQVAK